jgi:ribosomal protein S18 acetylase RimI-like enzyme
MTTGLTVSLAPLETERFGVATAKADLESPDDLPRLLSFCGEHRIHFLIVRCPARAAGTVQALEDGGFRLMDTRLTLETDLLHRPLAPRESTIRPLRAGEASTLESIAREAFAGYPGHFHADPRLDRKACDEAYVSWALRCRDPAVADEVLVAPVEGQLAGFAALRLADPSRAELVLGAVLPAFRGRGLYREMTLAGFEWARARGAERFTAVTHLSNLAAQRSWVRAGMLPVGSSHTFHRWFD